MQTDSEGRRAVDRLLCVLSRTLERTEPRCPEQNRRGGKNSPPNSEKEHTAN